MTFIIKYTNCIKSLLYVTVIHFNSIHKLDKIDNCILYPPFTLSFYNWTFGNFYFLLLKCIYIRIGNCLLSGCKRCLVTNKKPYKKEHYVSAACNNKWLWSVIGLYIFVSVFIILYNEWIWKYVGALIILLIYSTSRVY